MYSSSQHTSSDWGKNGGGSSYMTSLTGFTTLSNAYTSQSAVTPHGGALTSTLFNELKHSPLQQHLQTIPIIDETNRGGNSRSLMTVSIANSTPDRQNYGGYVNLSTLAAVTPMCK